MSTKTPSPKVVAGGAAGAAVTIIVWGAGLLGVEVPAEVAAAAVVLVTFAAGYIVPDAARGKHSAGGSEDG